MNPAIKKRIEDINNGIVPEGYKQTPFGIFPCDWETDKKLNDLGTFDKGKGLPGDEMCEYGVPCIGYGDIYMKYNYHFEKAQNFVDEETANESQPIEKGTLLFTGTGETAEEIGKCVCYNGDETIYAGGDIILFNSKDVSPLFLAYQQYQDFSLKKKATYGQGHSVVHIQRGELGKLNTAFSKDKTEQGKIAEILMKWDEMVELQEQYIQKLELRKKAIMKKLLAPKAEWKCVRFENTCKKFAYSKELQTNQYQVSGGYPVVDQGKNYIVAFTDEEDYIINNNCEGLLLFGDHTTEVKYLDFCFAVGGDGVKLFQKNGLYDLKFIYYSLLNTPFMIEGYKRHSNILRKKGIFVPFKNDELDIQEQNRIVEILTKLDKEISLQKEKLEKIKIQRKAMQQYLLTGIVRVV